jgi:uncharacterized protein YhaN
MALSDELKELYNSIDAMLFALTAIQKCLSNPDCSYYTPSAGSPVLNIVLDMQKELNTRIIELRAKSQEFHSKMDELASKKSK